jgi:hypothetical protein
MGYVILCMFLLSLGVYLSFSVTGNHRGDDPLDTWKP